MYKWIAKIPQEQIKEWNDEFYETYKNEYVQHNEEEFRKAFQDWIDNLIGGRNDTRVIKWYHLALASRDFFHMMVERDRDELLDKYPEVFI